MTYIPQELSRELPTTTVLERIRYLMYLTHCTQGQFAEKLGMNPGNFSKILTGKTPVSASLINRIVADLGVSKSWLSEGVDVPFAKPMHARELVINEPLEPDAQVAGTPVYDVDVTAGSQPLAQVLGRVNPSGFVNLPGVGRDSIIVQVKGDSMKPTIRNGGYVEIHQVRDTRTIFWGQIYVVQLDDYRMVKFLRRHHDPDRVILHSDNPDYDDMDILRREIRQLFLVDTVINIDLRC